MSDQTAIPDAPETLSPSGRIPGTPTLFAQNDGARLAPPRRRTIPFPSSPAWKYSSLRSAPPE